MKSAQILETIKTVSVIAYRKDFDGDTTKWQQAYFQMLSWKNTWGLAYDMDILESRKNGVYVWIVLHSADNAERLVEYMTDFGYRDIKTNWVNVGVCELPEGCDYLYEE